MPIEPVAPPFCARGGTFHTRRDLACALLLVLLFSPALIHAQRNVSQDSNPGGRGEPDRRADGSAPQQRPLPGGIFRHLRELPPAQQRRIMENNPQFQRLSPERQDLIRERLRQWNTMTPQQKETIREREEILEGLSPAQRQEARNIFPQWRNLTPPRRQALMVAFRHLRDLPPGQRESFLKSPAVREQFSPHERDILGGMNKLLPASREATPDDPDP